MLTRVADTPATRAYLEYGQPKRLVVANGGTTAGGTFGQVIAYGWSDLRTSGDAIHTVLGLDPAHIDGALLSGQAPIVGSLLIGIDAKTVGTDLDGFGPSTTSGATTTWRLRADDELSVTDRLAAMLPGIVSQLNLVTLEGDALRHGPSTNAVNLVSGSGATTMGASQDLRAIASCLGDPLAAVLSDKATGTVGEMVGVGVAGTASASTETLCVASETSTSATALAESMTSAAASGTSATSAQPWSSILADVKVTVVGGPSHVVRLVAKPKSAKAGVLFRALQMKDISSLLGR